jgi:sulfotransferase
MTRLILNSGLPRAGSTLLQNIFAQNPKFHVDNTSGLFGIVKGGYIGYATDNSVVRNPNKENQDISFLEYCKGGLQNYLNNHTSKPFVMDKDRGWYLYYPLMKKIIPNFKLIFLVRDLRSIFSSLEKQQRKDIFKPYNWESTQNNGITLELRYENYLQNDMIRVSLDGLLNLIQCNYLKDIHFLKYEDMCNFPIQSINNIYSYLNIDQYLHNFNDIFQTTQELDNNILFGDHKIKNKITPPSKDWNEILGKEISEDIYHRYKWYFEYFNYPQ